MSSRSFLNPFANAIGSIVGSSNNSSGTHSSSSSSNTLSRSSTLNKNKEDVAIGNEMEMKNKLKEFLLSIDKGMDITDMDLVDDLRSSNNDIQLAASMFLERNGFRQIEMNSTLSKVSRATTQPSPSSKQQQQQYHNAWEECNGSLFRVRTGPAYRKNKQKIQAQPETIYDCIAVDVYSTERKADHLSRFMKLPKEFDSTNQPYKIPEIFIVNFMLPLTEPAMSGIFDKDPANGPTACFHFVFRLSEWAKKNMDHNSINLMKRFIDNCQGEMKERLKLIVQVQNPEELNLGTIEQALCNKYNGLPFLFRGYNSDYYRGPNWLQATFDGHRSGYTTRKARYSLLSFAQMIVANFAVLVESETDEEMPERLLGCATVHRLCVVDAKRLSIPIKTPNITSMKDNSERSTVSSTSAESLTPVEPLSLTDQHGHNNSNNTSSATRNATEIMSNAKSFVVHKIQEIRHRVSSLSVYESADEGEDEDFKHDKNNTNHQQQ